MTTLATLPGPEIYEAAIETYAGYEVGVVLCDGRVRWISIATVLRALPGIDKTPPWQRYIGSKVTLRIRYKNKTVFDSDCISKRDFFAVALGHPSENAFRDAVATVIEKLDDNGMVVDARYAEHPLVKLGTASLQTALAVAKLEKRMDGLEQRERSQDRRIDDAYNLAETSLEIQRGVGNRLKAIPELGRRGYRFKTTDYGPAGGQLRAIALRLGDPLDSVPKILWNGDYVNTHLPQTFDEWERAHGPKYNKK
jgi:hypothetical protein